MTTTLITGGNKGLGYEAARRLLAQGHEVWIGARDAGRGEKAAADLGARFVQLDVTDDASVTAAVASVGTLDVLVNNAGIIGSRRSAEDPTAEEIREVFETNVFGAVRTFHAFLPLAAGLGQRRAGQRQQRPRVNRRHAPAGLPDDPGLVRVVEGVAQHADRTVVGGLPGAAHQRGGPRIHGDGPQRELRAADRDRGHRRDRGDGEHRRRRSDRDVHRPHRHRRLVT